MGIILVAAVEAVEGIMEAAEVEVVVMEEGIAVHQAEEVGEEDLVM